MTSDNITNIIKRSRLMNSEKGTFSVYIGK